MKDSCGECSWVRVHGESPRVCLQELQPKSPQNPAVFGDVNTGPDYDELLQSSQLLHRAAWYQHEGGMAAYR
jgi:hypothetical protein